MSQKIVEYVILEDFYIANITADVNRYMLIGWQPYGRPFCRGNLEDAYYYQAMVKYAKTTREKRLEERLELSLVAMKYAMKNIDPAYGTKVLDVLSTTIREIEDMGVAS